MGQGWTVEHRSSIRVVRFLGFESQLVVQASFPEWTDAGLPRDPAVAGIREGERASEVGRE